jgi:hypothetical protein
MRMLYFCVALLGEARVTAYAKPGQGAVSQCRCEGIFRKALQRSRIQPLCNDEESFFHLPSRD